jgi:putative membrane protein
LRKVTLSEVSLFRFLLRAVFAAAGLWVAANIFHLIRYQDWTTLAIAAVLLGVVNAIVRPIVVFFTLPFTIITLGLFLLVVNGLMLGLVGVLMDSLQVGGLWNAILASIVVSIISWIGSVVIGGDDRRRER